MAEKNKKGYKGPKRSNFILCVKIHDRETVDKFEQIQTELGKAMKINKNKLTESTKFHVTLLVLRIQNTAEYKELIEILRQAESIFRKYFDDQTIELQLKQTTATTNNHATSSDINTSADNDQAEDKSGSDAEESSNDEQDDQSDVGSDEESEEESADDEESGGEGEDLERIKDELKVTEKPLLRFQNVGHFYGSGKCIVWVGLKDDKHKVTLEHLAHELFKHVKKSNASFLIKGASSRFHPHVTLYKNKLEKSAKEIKGKSPMTPKKLANFCTKFADVDFGEQAIDEIIINVKTGQEEEDPDGFYKTYLSIQLQQGYALHIDVAETAPLDVVWQKQLSKRAKQSDDSAEGSSEASDDESSESSEEDNKPKFANWSKRQKKGLEQAGGVVDRKQKKFQSQQQRNKARRQKNNGYDD